MRAPPSPSSPSVTETGSCLPLLACSLAAWMVTAGCVCSLQLQATLPLCAAARQNPSCAALSSSPEAASCSAEWGGRVRGALAMQTSHGGQRRGGAPCTFSLWPPTRSAVPSPLSCTASGRWPGRCRGSMVGRGERAGSGGALLHPSTAVLLLCTQPHGADSTAPLAFATLSQRLPLPSP